MSPFPIAVKPVQNVVEPMNHALEQQLRFAEARFRTLVEEMPAIIYINAWDEPHPMLYVSPHVEEMLGYPAANWLERPGFVYSIVHPDDRHALRAENARTEAIGARFSLEYRLIARSGRDVWVRDECVPVYDAGGQPLFYQGIMIDVSDRRRAEEALRDSEGLFRGAFEYSIVGMTLSTPDGRYTRVNQAFCEMLGYSEAQLLDRGYEAITYPDDLFENRDYRTRLLSGEIDHFQIEKRYCHADGHPVWTLLSVAIVRDSRGDPLYIIGQAQDISDRKEAEARLTHQAFHDRLTGLPNRALFDDRIGHALERARRNGEKIAVMFLDLDGFKAVNDAFGHATGDQLLIALSARLRGWVRAGDTVARLGGDEFTVLLEDIGGREEATQIAARIIAGLETPIGVDGRGLWVRASLGIAFNRPADITADDLLRNADIALYRAKRSGGGQFLVHDEDHIAPHVGTSELRATYS